MIDIMRKMIIYKSNCGSFLSGAPCRTAGGARKRESKEGFMKKLLCMALAVALLLCPLYGCGNSGGDSEEEESTASASTEEALTEGENDTMHLNMLFSLIDTPDKGVTELLGEGERKYNADGSLKLRQFSGTVYSTDVTFIVYYDDLGDVSSIDVDFPTTLTEDALAATITQLTGRERTDDGTWRAETAVVTLEEQDDCYCMTLESYSATENAEDAE